MFAVQRQGKPVQHHRDHIRGRPGFFGALQHLHHLDRELLQPVHKLLAVIIGRGEDRDGLVRVFLRMLHRQPADNIDFVAGGIKLRVINDAGGIVRRVALSVVRTGQPHIGRRQAVPAGGVGMGAHHIIHQTVGLGQHAALGPAGSFHGHAQLRLRNKIAQVFGIGGGEGLVDGLVRVSHPHPVAGPGRQQAQHLFLDQGAVLGLILQDIGPAVLQVRQIAGVRSQQPVCIEHQVRKIHGGIVPQLGLIKAVDVADHLQQRTGEAVIRQRQVIPQLFGCDVVILRL